MLIRSRPSLRSRWRIVAAAAAVTMVALAGCDRSQDVTESHPSAPSSRRSVVTGSREPRPDEAVFVEIARDVPSYAGHFVDGSGRLAAYVSDSADFGRARAALASRIASGRLRVPSSVHSDVIHILKGAYSYQQLSDWRDDIFEQLGGRVSGLLTLDLDEAHNRVTIGVAAGHESASQAEILRRAAELDIPAAALRFESQRPIQGVTGRRSGRLTPPYNLGSLADTLTAGLQIGYITNGGPEWTCTAGFNALLSSGARALVTASHCSGTQWGYDGTNTQYYQPNHFGRSVGYEGYDPSPGDCPALWGCSTYRFSDANIVVVTATNWRRGVLARPQQRVYEQAGTTTLDGARPYLYVTGIANQIYQNQVIDKIGERTGWTWGTVTNTCVDWWEGAYERMVRCAYKTSLYTDGGDSGSPVFDWDGQDGVLASGILFARDDNSLSGWFSKWSNVINELTGSGSITTSLNVETDITMTGTPSLSGILSGGAALSWTVVSVSGTSTTTVYEVYRSTWDASTYSWIDHAHVVASPTGTSYTDGPSINMYSVSNEQPNACVNSYVEYTVVAYNSGRTAASNTLYFVGDANGADPNQINCQ